jgi:hypothetical protein
MGCEELVSKVLGSEQTDIPVLRFLLPKRKVPKALERSGKALGAEVQAAKKTARSRDSIHAA